MSTFLLKSCIFFSKFSRKCDIGCDFKTTVSSYIKEQLKFASFLGVEGGGGQNSPLKSPTFICNDRNQCFLMLIFS